jgi:muramoyltetrapeptide carboxypeptidase
METLIKPERLRLGDTVGIVAPASPPPDPKAIDRAIESLESAGFKPKLGNCVRERHGFLAGNDRDRAADIMEMFSDRNVKAVMCLRGGYGSARLLNLLDFEVIRRNVKIFSGFSDITSLHCAMINKVGMITVHAPMLHGGLLFKKSLEFARASFLRTIMEPKPSGSIVAGLEEKKNSVVRKGVVEGQLIGGNLSVLCATLGTPFQPSFKGKILFLEDIGEKPYRLDRMLTHLLNAGILQQVAGIAVGVNRDCEDTDEAKQTEYRQSSADVFKERLSELGVPVVVDLPFGHVDLHATIPIGARARLDGDNGDLSVLEAAVS